MRRPAALIIAIVALAATIGVAGCGDDEETTVTEERTVTEVPAPETEPTAAPTEPPAEVRNQGPRHFQTPSGNIGCYLDRSGARCDIRERNWAPPPAPASCELDYGHGLTLDSDGATLVCAGDTTLGGPATLAYGSSSQRGRFLCQSAEAGVTCTDVTTGAGFFISRENYRILPSG